MLYTREGGPCKPAACVTVYIREAEVVVGRCSFGDCQNSDLI